MLKIFLISVLSFGFSFAAHAQTSAPQDKTAESESESSEKDASEQPQKADSQPEAEDSAVREPIDIDEYFKNGEENAKKGFSCNMPSEPIA